ncbi:putative ILEI domain-containing protein [Dickeya phage vB_DsoM_JA13]|uniref:Putative ILEI domain-containing protein n=1 Tax=Dickeya phage vB_DsoM_JA13 TaxID=2283030 RepID=A0A384ZW81_9CAUD|nr:putative ILEI domain-containing protein [Dickeya phage vB_DsoM_JA13]
MIKRSCLYLRGLTFGYSGGGGPNTQSWADASMAEDRGTMTGIAIDGHASGFICGYGAAFMNGAFVTPYSFDVNPSGGWVGDYSKENVNSITGMLRQLRIMMDMGANFTHGKSILIMSDSASVTDRVNFGQWGQFCYFLQKKRYDILPHHVNEIAAGAYGYDGQPHYFKQFALTVFLLSSTGRTINDTMAAAIRNAIKEGISFVVLQKGPGEGTANFNAIFSPIGIYANRNTNIVCTKRAHDANINAYNTHVAWNGVEQLHYKLGYLASQGYWFSDTGEARQSAMSGQPGTWIPFMCADVDINDDVRLNSPFFYKDYCCADPQDGFSVDYDISVYPYKPDDWRNGIQAGYHKITWQNDSAQSLAARSQFFCHVVGYGVPNASGSNPGFTIINGTRYNDGRSLNVYKISKATRQLVERRNFDIHGAGGEGSADGIANAAAMAAYLNSIDGNYWVLVTMFDECSYNRLTGGLPAALYRIGASRRVWEDTNFQYRGAYNCFGSPGVGEGNAINEMYKGSMSSDPNSTFDVGYSFDPNGWPYVTGTELFSKPAVTNKGLFNDQASQHSNYYKVLDDPDGSKYYGVKHNAELRDVRFHKLPMYEAKDFVVSVEHPCIDLGNYPTFSVNDVSVVEGSNLGYSTVTFTVTASEEVMGRAITMTVQTRDGTARCVSNETTARRMVTPGGVSPFSFIEYQNTRVVWGGSLDAFTNNNLANNAQSRQFLTNAIDWLGHGHRNDKILIVGDSFTGSPYPTGAYRINEGGANDLGSTLVNHLRSMQFTVDVAGWTQLYGGAPSALIFDQYVIVIFVSANPNPAAKIGIAFTKALENSVRRGTGMMVLTGQSNVFHSANMLANRFYVNYSGAYAGENLDMDGVRNQIGSHQLINGMSGLWGGLGGYSDVRTNGNVGDPQDYIPIEPRQLLFPVGAKTVQVSVQVYQDKLTEGDEYFYLVLSDLSRSEFTRNVGVCTILDDDGTPFGSAASSGGQGVEWRRQLYRNNTGVFILWSEHYTVPDRVDIFRDGLWLDSSPKGGQAPYDYPSGPIYRNLPNSGGQHEIYIAHYAELDYTPYYDVRMQGTGDGTAWDYNTRDDSVKGMSGSYNSGKYVSRVFIHNVESQARRGAFRIRVDWTGGNGEMHLRRVGVTAIRATARGTYFMEHDTTRDFKYIEVFFTGSNCTYTISVVDL